MRTSNWRNCFKCNAKLKNLVEWKGESYCRYCYRKETGIVPYIRSKGVKCASCGDERKVGINVTMPICTTCQKVMEDVR